MSENSHPITIRNHWQNSPEMLDSPNTLYVKQHPKRAGRWNYMGKEEEQLARKFIRILMGSTNYESLRMYECKIPNSDSYIR